MLVKDLKYQILDIHKFDELIYNGKKINKSYIHKAKKDELENILNLLIINNNKTELLNKLNNLNYTQKIIRYFDINNKKFQFISIKYPYDFSLFNYELLEIIYKQLINNDEKLNKIRNKLIKIELDINYKYPLLNLNGGFINCDNKIYKYQSVYNNYNDITEYSYDEIKNLINKIKNRIHIFDMIYNEFNKEKEYKFLCNIVDKNYNNNNLENKELDIFKDALFKVGYGNMRYKFNFNNLQNIFNQFY